MLWLHASFHSHSSDPSPLWCPLSATCILLTTVEVWKKEKQSTERVITSPDNFWHFTLPQVKRTVSSHPSLMVHKLVLHVFELVTTITLLHSEGYNHLLSLLPTCDNSATKTTKTLSFILRNVFPITAGGWPPSFWSFQIWKHPKHWPKESVGLGTEAFHLERLLTSGPDTWNHSQSQFSRLILAIPLSS
jgi:hypothetical protein